MKAKMSHVNNFVQVGLAWSETYFVAFVMLVLFFGAFNVLEAMLPASVARIAPADMKGTAMGLFSSAQFIGAFAGGVLGGLLLSLGDYTATLAVYIESDTYKRRLSDKPLALPGLSQYQTPVRVS